MFYLINYVLIIISRKFRFDIFNSISTNNKIRSLFLFLMLNYKNKYISLIKNNEYTRIIGIEHLVFYNQL